MRVAHVGNMANDGYATVKALRANGVEADLLINTSDFGMSQPQWELYDVRCDPYVTPIPNLGDYPLPKWIKPYTCERSVIKQAGDFYRASRKYDLIHCHYPTFLFQQFNEKPYIIYEAGFLRRIHDYHLASARGSAPKMNWEHLGLDAYARAECVTWTNTDMDAMIKDVAVKSERFLPFAIDTERYSPAPQVPHDALRILHPTRQVWDVKGNDRLLRAFTAFVKDGNEAHLTLVDWGYEEDVAAAKAILAPVEEHVAWVPPMSKPRLIKAYRESDVVADQFFLGGSGTTGYEAMSCGKPVMIYFADSARRCYGEAPPCVNVRTEEDILLGLEKLQCETYRRRLGEDSRDFVERHLSEEVVAGELKEVYDDAEAN